MAYHATKFGILFGWGFAFATLIAVLLLPHGAAMALLPISAVISGVFLGPRQGRPLPELVEEHPRLWRIVAICWLAVACLALYMAFFHRIVINFLLDTPIGWLILLSLLLGPLVPSIFTHERERYRNAPRY